MRAKLLGVAGALGVLGVVSIPGTPRHAPSNKHPRAKPAVVKPAAKRPQTPLPPGPPAQIAQAKEFGRRLLARYKMGSLKLVRTDREPAQLKQLAAAGYVLSLDRKPVFVAIPVLRMLDRLSARSTKERPLELLSLYRPPSPGRPLEPHANGLAADIWAFEGHRIDNHNAKECTAGVTAVLDTLGPGEYRLGVPKAPYMEPVPFLPAPPRPVAWPFFPAPVPQTFGFGNWQIVVPRLQASRVALSSRGGVRPQILLWENERGAPLSEIGSHAVRLAVRKAEARGARIPVLFPDAADHLHIHVPPQPPGPRVVIARLDDPYGPL
jgi:hypothetical protein